MSVEKGTWATIDALAGWLDRENVGRGWDRDHETAMRIMKIGEEFGEVVAAYIGMTGQNPRKGVICDREDVAAELCDVILTAAVALHRFTVDPRLTFADHVAAVAERVGVSAETSADGSR